MPSLRMRSSSIFITLHVPPSDSQIFPVTLNFLFYQVYRNHPGFARCFIPKFDKKAHGISVLAPKSMTLIVLLRPGAIFPACGLVFWKNSSILEAISRGILCCPGQQGAAVLQRTSRWGEGVDPYENRIDHGRRCHAGHVHGGRAGRSDGERPCDRRCDRRVGRRGVWLQLQITPDRPRHPL